MRTGWMALAAGLAVLFWASGASAGCWCGNGVSVPETNLVEAQVWPGDGGVTTWMDFIYTTDGTDPYNSGTAQTEPGIFFQFADNNDWYQATLTANAGDLVRWFARAQSADQETCDSEEYQFISGETPPPPPPNLVGDCESELGVGGDWQNNDDMSKMWDPDEDGIFEVTLTAVEDFSAAPGQGYQVVGTSGQWSPQYPGDSNIPINFTAGEEITFSLDTNPVPGWSPESNAVYDSKLINETHTWAAVGGWQGWDPTSTETEMTDIGDGVFCLVYYFPPEMAGTHEYKCAADDDWYLQCGINGYGSNSSTWSFDTPGDECLAFYLDTNTGRITIEFGVGPSSAEGESWGSIKSMYR